MKNIFITGTDTGVGKTLISKILIEYFVSKGESVAPMKPVASGAFFQNDILVNDDALVLIKAANTHFDYSTVNPYVFKEPIAPHLAAEKANNIVDIEYLNLKHSELEIAAEHVVIEGAGGWQVPLNRNVSMADWVSDNQWPVILVVGLRLGCINHARLSYLDIIAKKSRLAGWVVNSIDPEVLEAESVIADMEQFIKAPLLGVIPWLGNETESDIAHCVDFSLMV